MIDSLRRLHPVHHNVLRVWEEFEQVFKDKFVDSMCKLRARNQLKQLKFKYPEIDKYIVTFEDLVVHARYNLGLQEAINVTAKMATPLSRDSKLSDGHLELLKR